MSTTNQTHETVSNDDVSYTYHAEPPAQGGERYVRCESCEREILADRAEYLSHKSGCPNTTEDY